MKNASLVFAIVLIILCIDALFMGCGGGGGGGSQPVAEADSPSMVARVGALESALATYQGKVDALEASQKEYQARITDLESNHLSNTNRIFVLEENEAVYKNQISELELTLTELKNKTLSLTEELNHLKEKVPTSGSLYGVTNAMDAGVGNYERKLIKIDPLTGITTPISVVTNKYFVTMHGIDTIDPINKKIYWMITYDDSLKSAIVTIDAKTGTANESLLDGGVPDILDVLQFIPD